MSHTKNIRRYDFHTQQIWGLLEKFWHLDTHFKSTCIVQNPVYIALNVNQLSPLCICSISTYMGVFYRCYTTFLPSTIAIRFGYAVIICCSFMGQCLLDGVGHTFYWWDLPPHNRLSAPNRHIKPNMDDAANPWCWQILHCSTQVTELTWM